ncbi:MAG TPA: non-lysosomal glucosylceramidase [Candidatus Saccharimonadales bacterium]|nr:non-lysosomal glucosylceramidase [Candidatus Saccharimonadales bacterium]
MKSRALPLSTVFLCLVLTSPLLRADDIPKAAWRRPLGQPLDHPGTKKPALDAGHIDDGFWQGAPVGGFGAGTFSRTYRGDFARWHMQAGIHKYQTVDGDQFAMFQKSEGEARGEARVLASYHPAGGTLSSWQWDYPVGAGDYAALYPKSWFDYRSDKFPAHVTLEQFSPILPDNYKESSYPVAVYRWHAENPTKHRVTVSVLLSWENMLGWFRTNSRNLRGGLNHGNFNRFSSESLGSAGTMKGVIFDRNHLGPATEQWDGQFTIAALEEPGVEVSYQSTFDPRGAGEEIWAPFSKDGKLSNSDDKWTSSGEAIAGAIAVRFTLEPGEKRIVPMVISWDLPIVQFGSGRKWNRRYTDFYGTAGTSAWTIARDALQNGKSWSDAIDAWQAPYINDESKPLWYRGMLFNEMYVLADEGSFWGRPVGSDPKLPPVYSFMECYDYPYYETLDVRFYGSMPLLKFWPDIEKGVMREFADTVPQESAERMVWVWKAQQTKTPQFRIRKAKGAVPHDLGVPEEDPFKQINQFSWQDTNGWKDLNTKFVLMVYRDYVLTGRKDQAFLKDTWPAVQEALNYLRQYDKDGDGIPENEGYPDQTYDEWVVRGESAYSGGLWLASLRAAEEIGRQLGDAKAAGQYHELFAKSQASYIKKLWNGEYFHYDMLSDYRDNIQADQLAGQWYANMTGLGDLVPREMQLSALRKIFDFNVMKFHGGDRGAVNGMTVTGSVINVPGNQQVAEVWTGTTMGVAALMLSDGMKEQAFKTIWGVYHTSYEEKGYWFRTPEAWDITGNYRASMYMRPAAIWAMEMMSPGKAN